MNLTTFLKENAKFALDEKRSLNPSVWKRDKLLPEVREALNKIGDAFVKYLNVTDLKVVDYIMTGSLANYTWHKDSDIDLHILVELPDDKNHDNMIELFMAKKGLWNAEHGIEIKGFPVELYVQPASEKHASTGVYSLKKNEWITQPKKQNPSIDDDAVLIKANKWKSKINALLKNNNENLEQINAFKTKLRDMRKMGLDKSGEFAIENLAFKILRNDGFIKKLYDYSKDLEDKQFSLK
jgi:hypothetical protein